MGRFPVHRQSLSHLSSHVDVFISFRPPRMN